MSDLLVEELKQVDINSTTAIPDVGSATERTSDKERSQAIPGSGSTRQTDPSHGQSIDVHVSRIRSSDYDTGLTSSTAQRFTRETTGLTSPTAQRFTRDTTPGLHSPRKRTLSPIRASVNRGRSRSPDKYSSVQRELRTSSPERTFVMSKSPDRSRIWSQWDLPDNKKECLQDYNVRQMEWLYGKPLGGQVETALHWYREKAMVTASAPVSFTPRGTQTAQSMSADVDEQAYKRFVGSPYKNSEMKAREMMKAEKSLNKLSTRHRVQRTPGVNEIRAREQKFTNDAVVTETRRTRFKDIIPQYDASNDKYCKAYFKRRDVQRLLSVTCSRDNTPAGSVTPGQTPAGFTPRPTPGATPF